MPYADTLQDNLAKGQELRPDVQGAYTAWVQECFAAGLYFRVTETYRTQERQNELYKVGRRGIAGEQPVTWTLYSNHTLRLAADCYPITGTLNDLIVRATPYGITHPLPTLDPPHFEFLNVKPPAPPPVDPQTQLTWAQNALRWAVGLRRAVLLRMIDRLKKLLGQ